LLSTDNTSLAIRSRRSLVSERKHRESPLEYF
jgi:hypothetical protein